MKKRYLVISLIFLCLTILFYFMRNCYYDFYSLYKGYIFGLLIDISILFVILSLSSEIKGLTLIMLVLELCAIFCLILSIFGHGIYLPFSLGLNLIALIMIRIISKKQSK